jgi:argininosuccinate lyase
VADVVAQACGVDYRTAHKVVGRAVRDVLDAGLPPSELTVARIREAGREVAGAPLEVPEEVLREALDPLASARTRLQEGSSSPAAMDAMLRDCRARLEEARAWSAAAAARAAEGDRLLDAAADAIAAQGSTS